MIMILQLDVQVVHKVLESASAQKAPTVQYSVLQQGENCINSLGHHHFDELLVVDLSISINVGFANHFIDLFIGKLLAKVGHHMPQLRSTDKSVTIAIENLERLDELLLSVSVLHLTGHQGKELWEIDGAVTIGIHLVDHVLKLSLRWVLSKGAHDCSQLLGGDGAIAVLVEQGEGLLELGNLLLSKLVRHWVLLKEYFERARVLQELGFTL